MSKRRLQDLVSVGPATLQDLELLGVLTVAQLARQDPSELYGRLAELTGFRHDPCCEDVFRAAVAQARDPELPDEQRQWWYWSRRRKAAARAAPYGTIGTNPNPKPNPNPNANPAARGDKR